MRRTIFLIVLVFLPAEINFQAKDFSDVKTESKQVKISSTAPWSQRIADSFILRHPADIINDSTYHNKWTYDQGVVLEGLQQLWNHTHSKKYFDYIKTNMDQYISGDGGIKKYKYSEYTLDNITPGRQLLFLYKKTKENKYKIAADTLRKQISFQPRTKSGGFWHKMIYPHQMWLDGLYMCEPFYAEYSRVFNEPKNFEDIIHQFILIEKKTRDPKTGLLYHAWDESKQQKWADSVTGTSHIFWGRAMGWYAMALVDVLDFIPRNNPRRKELITILQNFCDALLKYRDPQSKVWFQVVDQYDRKGNFPESSASCMFTYTFAKAANKGYVKKDFLKRAKESFDGIIKTFVTIDKDGYVNLNKTVDGIGLGGNPYRDGSFEYYTGVRVKSNDLRALGPFILSALELEKAKVLK